MDNILDQLAAGDMRTKGASEQVVPMIANDQKQFDAVFDGLRGDNPGLRMRCADALEKASRQNPELIKSHKADLLGKIGATTQQEVQWHVAQMITRLELSDAERHEAVKLMERYYAESPSNIVRASALQTIVDFAKQDTSIRALADAYLQKALGDPSHALQARARNLL